MSLLIGCWYTSLSTITSSSASPSLWLGSIGVSVGLHANLSICLRISVTYFCWKIKIPCLEIKISYLECTISIPRKYFNILNSLITNSLVKHCLKVCLSFPSFLVMMMLSTYTRRVVTPPKFECLTNNVWFSWLCLYPMFFITLANLPNYTIGDCFSLCRAFFSLYTFSVVRLHSNPRTFI